MRVSPGEGWREWGEMAIDSHQYKLPDKWFACLILFYQVRSLGVMSQWLLFERYPHKRNSILKSD